MIITGFDNHNIDLSWSQAFIEGNMVLSFK